ncbi:MAG TPA: Spy/CpxP family protein refolding chaperone [Halothiobacillus sp.]|nr:Spy/CpxP family protein refolding chaperone [Halothiobacillus sp.]
MNQHLNDQSYRVATRVPSRMGLGLALMACVLWGLSMSQNVRAEEPAAQPGQMMQGGMHERMSGPMTPERWEKMRVERKRHVEVRLHEMANRLQITAAQEPVWKQYESARLAMMPEHVQRPKAANAAEIAQFRADRMKAMAERMAVLSTATANLRSALDENQRKVLDDMAQRFKHHGGHKFGEKQGQHCQHG